MVNYKLSNRRAGDVISIFANNEKAKNVLRWIPEYNLDDMMRTAWNWELKLIEQEEKIEKKANLN